MRRALLWPLTALSCGLALVAQDARACGGCFAPPAEATSFVVAHRMAFAVNETRTVLWDQFSYEGDPEDFSWVLRSFPARTSKHRPTRGSKRSRA